MSGQLIPTRWERGQYDLVEENGREFFRFRPTGQRFPVNIEKSAELPFEVMKVRSPETALRYLRLYGVLGYQLTSEWDSPEPLDFLLGHAQNLRLLLELYRCLDNAEQVQVMLKKMFAGLFLAAAGPYQSVFVTQGGQSDDPRSWSYWSRRQRKTYQLGNFPAELIENAPVNTAKQLISWVVTENLSDGRLPVLHAESNGFKFAENYASPLAAVYGHFSRFLVAPGTADEKLETCAAPDCRELFYQRDKRSKYCPAFGTRSRCENRHRAQINSDKGKSK